MFEFRPFRNTDPPRLVEIWNECFQGRGSYPIRSQMSFEGSVFSKPYFDRNGLILACDNGAPVGFAHGGFAANSDQSALDKTTGVVCVVAVRPSHRRRNIGGELLRRVESYLTSNGASSLQAGPGRPNNPFYLGLYGGSDSPGILASDPAAEPFFERYGYTAATKRDVYQRRLDQPVSLPDFRVMQHRKRYDIVAQPTSGLSSWWQERIVGLIEPVEFRLEDRLGNVPVGRAIVWELDGFSAKWNKPSAGIYEFIIRADQRGFGLGKFFLVHLLRYVQEQFFGICECHVNGGSSESKFLASMEFEKVDEGTTLFKSVSAI